MLRSDTRQTRVRLAILAVGLLIGYLFVLAAVTPAEDTPPRNEDMEKQTQAAAATLQQATFGAGCFWCVEAVFEQLEGVHSAVSGYSGGKTKNPTYKAVCTGRTGHAEVVQVTFDPAVISFDELLEVFWQTHDPTTLNRQGNDVGTQYRSAIFFHNEQQREAAEGYKKKLDASAAFDAPIVTEISPHREFFPAEDYHQQYFELNGHEPYCAAVVKPKVDKVRKVFRDKLKTAASSERARK